MTLETIRRATVGVVLRELARGAAPTCTPLDELEVVRRALVVAGFEATPRARRHELARLLLGMVEEELGHLRRLAGAGRLAVREPSAALGYRSGVASGRGAGAPILERRMGAQPAAAGEPLLPAAAYATSPAMLRARIREDFGHGHAALEAQSAIYHLYLRPDLGLSLDEFVALLGDRHRRTVQRRLSRGVAMVVDRLHERERAALLATRREQLAGRLPRVRGPLVGVADAVESLADALAGGASILLAGEAGAGKSALARAAVARLLEREALEDLVWLETAEGADPSTIVAEVRHQLRRPEAGCTDGVLLVVDGLDTPRAARGAAAAAAALGLTSLLIGRGAPAALGQVAARLMTPPALGQRAARALLRQEVGRRGGACDEAAWPSVVAATAGHPRALRRAAAAMRAATPAEVAGLFVDGQGPAGALYSRMWESAWREAPSSARETVRAVMALRRGGIVAHAANVARLRGLPASAVGAGLDAALDAGLLSASPDGALTPARFLRRWLALMAEDDLPRLRKTESSGLPQTPAPSVRSPDGGPIRGWDRGARSAAASAGSRP